MKIAYFTDTFVPQVNGVVSYLSDLSRELVAAGHEVGIFYPADTGRSVLQSEFKNISLFPVRSLPALVYPNIRLGLLTPISLKEALDFNPDIVHVHSPGPLGFEGLLVGKRQKVPVIGSFHTYFMEPEYLRIVRLDRFIGFSKILWRLTLTFYNQCDVVVTPSQTTGDDLVRHGYEGELKVLPYGIDLSLINPKATPSLSISRSSTDSLTVSAARSLSPAEGKVNNLIYFGRLSKEKNLSELISIFADIQRVNIKAQLLLIGDGPLRESLSAQVEELSLQDQVQFLGEVSHHQLLALALPKLGKIFVTTSTSETLGISIVEAMAFGLPVVAYKAKAIQEVVVGEVGRLCRTGDRQSFVSEVNNLLNSPQAYNRAAKAARQLAIQYSIQKVAQDVVNFYKSLL
jgi:1,2-diacylglycerol 3-alpha-glucosyltransferase